MIWIPNSHKIKQIRWKIRYKSVAAEVADNRTSQSFMRLLTDFGSFAFWARAVRRYRLHWKRWIRNMSYSGRNALEKSTNCANRREKWSMLRTMDGRTFNSIYLNLTMLKRSCCWPGDFSMPSWENENWTENEIIKQQYQWPQKVEFSYARYVFLRPVAALSKERKIGSELRRSMRQLDIRVARMMNESGAVNLRRWSIRERCVGVVMSTCFYRAAHLLRTHVKCVINANRQHLQWEISLCGQARAPSRASCEWRAE